MIACRSLLGISRVPKVASSCGVSRPLISFQVQCRRYHALRFGSNNMKESSGSDWQTKRRKRVDLVWRTVSAQATTRQDLVAEGPMNESEGSSRAQQVIAVSSGIDIGNDTAARKDEDASSSEKQHSVSLEVGSSLMRFIKGKGGSTQKKIEDDTGVKILFPSSKEEDSIVIEGSSADDVAKASNKIQAIVDEAVETRLDYSHFISLPLAIHPELVDKLFVFQKSILGSDGSAEDVNLDAESSEGKCDNEVREGSDQPASNVTVKLNVEDISSIPRVSYAPKAKTRASESSSPSELGIDRSIFIKPQTFHLTVLMLKLWNKERMALASEVLQSISSKVIDALDNRPIFIRLKGLDCMKGSLAKARVLYIPVKEIGSEGRLRRACQVIIEAYNEAGLVLDKDAKQSLKLHATVMNARHRKRKTWNKPLEPFDARGIFKQYGSEEWGDYIIREAHLSQRFAFNDKGYYQCCASIPFPESMQLD